MTTEEMCEIMKASTEGKSIEVRHKNDKDTDWTDITFPCWNWVDYEYRVKPEKKEPTYRPYKTIEEMSEHIKKRFDENYGGMQHPVLSGICLKQTEHKVEHCINSLDYDEKLILLGTYWTSLQVAFDNYTYLDGTPFGVQEY